MRNNKCSTINSYRQYYTRGRIYIQKTTEGYLLIDHLDGNNLLFDKRKDATEAKQFADAYIKKHGDIDLASFPYSLDQLLHHDKYTKRRWKIYRRA